MDAVFKALADPTRRALLDELFRQDGQTLSALEARFTITRYTVMKHLRTLEAAGLVLTRRPGREKLHFLNPVPVRLVHDRWVSEYAERCAAGLSDLKSRLETPMEKLLEIYIRTTPRACGTRSPILTSGAGTTSGLASSRTGPRVPASRCVPRALPARSAKGAIRRWIRRGGRSRAWSRRGATG